MQLTKTTSIRAALSLATCSLFNTSALAAPEFKFIDSVLSGSELKASNMLYAEDNRVIVNESVISVQKEINDDEYLKATFIVDLMSGPSPNGLPPINKPQESDTFTSPSGSTVQPRADKEQTFHFRDTRGALSLEWQKPLSRLLKTTNSISFSAEYDYYSMGFSSSFSKDSEDRLTTLNTGIAANYDNIRPVGGAPQGLTPITNDDERSARSKTEYDLLLGITQVVSRHTLFQANYVANYKTGYLTDPYKLVIFLDNDDLAPVNKDPYYHEKRPGSRLSHIVYFNVIQNIFDDVAKFSYRYFDDDWGVASHTLETRYLKSVSERIELQIKYRYTTQNEAYFYHYHLVDGPFIDIDSRDIVNLPTDLKYVSADYRLGNLQSHAVGTKITRYFPQKDARIDFRIDRIISSDKKERFETVRAWVVQLAGKITF